MWCGEAASHKAPTSPTCPASWAQGEHVEERLHFFSVDPACDRFSRHLSFSQMVFFP